MLVAAEGGFCGFLVFAGVAGEFELEGAELVVDDFPDDLVGGHGGLVCGALCGAGLGVSFSFVRFL